MARPAKADAPPAAAREQKVEAVERALSILDAFGNGRARLTLSELGEATGLYHSTVLRLAASLERFGYVRRDADGYFRLGPSLLRLGVLYQNTFDLSDYVRPILAALVRETTESAGFYVREGERRVCLYRENAPRQVRNHVEVGTPLPLDCGASGRILSAYDGGEGDFYAGVRQAGFYISLGERDPEAAAVSAPVFGGGGRFIGALGVSGPRSRMEGEPARRYAAIVVEKAATLSRLLAGQAHGMDRTVAGIRDGAA